MKNIIGYVRSIPGGLPVAGVPVSIRLKKDGTLVPAGGMIQSSINPINTDTNGRFEWSTELSPGSLMVEAAIDSGAELKVRSGEEVMQAGDIFISDIKTMGKMFTDGVIDNLGNTMEVAPVIGSLQVEVKTGAANIGGVIFQLESNRVITIDPNTTITGHRRDLVCLDQYVSGADKGKQDIVVVKGTVSGVTPPVAAPADVVRLALARVIIPLSATSVTTERVAAYASPTNVTIDPGQILLTHLSPEVRDVLTDDMFTITAPTTGQHLAYNGSKWVNEGNLLSNAEDALIASPANNQVLTYSAGKWKNMALPAAPAITIAGATDTTITSPANNSVLTWNTSTAKWIDQALPAPPTVSIAAATDTVIVSPVSNQLLAYVSGKWRNANLNIDIPSSKSAEVNFSQYGDLGGSNVLIASCAVAVPAGTWLIRGEASGQMYVPSGGGGAVNIWFQGSAVTSSNARVHFTNGNWRQWFASTRRVVTTGGGTYTLDLWAAHQSGATTRFGAGNLNVMAV